MNKLGQRSCFYRKLMMSLIIKIGHY